MFAFTARLFRHEAAGGIILMLAAAAAMVVANSPWEPAYDGFLDATFSVTLNGAGLAKPLILWINDGLMAVFFFLVGLELKREVLEGKLRNPRDIVLPGLAAVGGMAVPALIFAAVNLGRPTLAGWAIPAATDIAFALGILALIGARAPASLKVFLLTLAILDDLGAIVIIALFYTAELKAMYLGLALLPLAGLVVLNLSRVGRHAPYILLGAVLWILVLKSGVHATLAGVATALLVPLHDRKGGSPLHLMEHALTPYVGFLIVPLFAFANAGVILAGMSPGDFFAPLPLGIAAGLVLGKFVGVFGTTWLLVRFGLARLPEGAGWMHLAGVACLAGIGFTMSLFIGGLSFTELAHANQVRLGVLCGSAIAAVAGYAVLMLAPRPAP
jgi:Na+:H+ antiporter, NhaA family